MHTHKHIDARSVLASLPNDTKFELIACLPACIHINTLIIAAYLLPYLMKQRLLQQQLLLSLVNLSISLGRVCGHRLMVPWCISDVELRRSQTFSTQPREEEADARAAEAQAVMERI
jgi:hypothetical protein